MADSVTDSTLPFLKRLEARAQAANSLLCVGLDPHPEFLPEATGLAAYQFCTRIIDQTHDMAAAFKPNSAFFEALGASGVEALRNVIAYIHATDAALPVILDAKRGDISSTAEAYASAAFDYLNADAITLNPYLGYDAIKPFLRDPSRGAFLLCRTSNQSAGELQDIRIGSRTVYETVAAFGVHWNVNQNLGLVVGATDSAPLRVTRLTAPAAWFLVPGVGAQGGDLETAVRAGLRSDRLGLLINAGRSIAAAPDPRAEAMRLRDAINTVRAAEQTAEPKRLLAVPDSRTILAARLANAECIRFGRFTLKSGIQSPIYLDLRRLVSYPSAMKTVCRALGELLKPLSFQHLAAIPYAALPIASVVAADDGYSLIYPRREAKAYGTKAEVEGVFNEGDRVVLIDDLATTGESKFEAIDKLKAVGLAVTDIVVVIDREQGARETLEAAGYRFHALITLRGLLDELEGLGNLSRTQRAEVDAFLAASGSGQKS